MRRHVDRTRPDWVRAILAAAGFDAIGMQRCDVPLFPGATVRSPAEFAVRTGPVSRFVREIGVEHLPTITDADERALAPLASSDGSVSLAGWTWIVSANSG